MDQRLVAFAQMLRIAKIRVSTSEVIDAFNTVKLIGYEDRTNLKNALSCVLSKTEREKSIFHTCFDQFFSFKHVSDQLIENRIEVYSLPQGSNQEQILRKILKNNDVDPVQPQSELARMLFSGDNIGFSMALSRAAKAAFLNQLNSPFQRGMFIHRILKNMGIESLDAELLEHQQNGDDGQLSSKEYASRLQAKRDDLFEVVRSLVEKQILLHKGRYETHLLENILMETRLTSLEKKYFEDVNKLVKKMAKQLAIQHSRRKKVSRQGHLDMRKTLRYNLKYGGTLFNIHWKKIKIEHPKIFALCDVSHSVGNISRFFLAFLYSLQENLTKVRSFAFSSHMKEVSSLFDQYPLEESLLKVLELHGAGSTDYGRALKQFQKQYLDDIDSRTIIIILGDARNNGKNPHSDIVEQLYKRCKYLLWLNPEFRNHWVAGDSEMYAYLPFCHFHEVCNSLQHIENMFKNFILKNK